MPVISTLTVLVESQTSKFTSGMKVATAGLAALAGAGVYAFNQFEESNKVAAQTDAVLKSTGGAANVTASQVSDLAAALSEKSGIDDEAIQSGENMLLTFKNIRDEAGKGNDIFDRASSATLDMAAGMAAASGGAVDMKGASIQLGKALNDPVAGLSALSRIGVQFTDKQKKQIEQMVKSGDTLGAQKMILKEVNSEFRGSAEAQKTATGEMSTSFGNLAEAIGGVLAPAINGALGLAITFIGWLTKYPGVLVAVGAAVAILTAAWLVQKVVSGILTVQAAAINLVTGAQWLWNAAVSANPIGLIILAVVALVGIIVLLVKHFHLADDIMNVLKKTVDVVWGFIKAVVGAVVRAVIGYVKLWLAVAKVVFNGIKAVATAVWGAIKGAWNAAKGFFSDVFNAVKDVAVNVWHGIKDVVSGVWGSIKDAAKSGANFVIGILNDIIGAINTVIGAINHLPGPDLPTIGTIPTLQTGGVVMRTGLAVVHEGERFSGVGKGWGSTVNVYVQGSVIAEHDLAETVQKVLLRQKKRTGALGLG